MVAFETTFKLLETIGTATDTSNLSVTPSVRKAVNRATVASMELTVVTTSSRPPRSSALSCVNTAGTLRRSSPSIVSKVKR